MALLKPLGLRSSLQIRMVLLFVDGDAARIVATMALSIPLTLADIIASATTLVDLVIAIAMSLALGLVVYLAMPPLLLAIESEIDRVVVVHADNIGAGLVIASVLLTGSPIGPIAIPRARASANLNSRARTNDHVRICARANPYRACQHMRTRISLCPRASIESRPILKHHPSYAR